MVIRQTNKFISIAPSEKYKQSSARSKGFRKVSEYNGTRCSSRDEQSKGNNQTRKRTTQKQTSHTAKNAKETKINKHNKKDGQATSLKSSLIDSSTTKLPWYAFTLSKDANEREKASNISTVHPSWLCRRQKRRIEHETLIFRSLSKPLDQS